MACIKFIVLSKSVSRFARNTVDSLTTVRQLKEKGIEIYFEKENIWTLDSKGDGGYSKMIQFNGSGAIARQHEIRALREIRFFGFLLNALIFDFANANLPFEPCPKFAPGAYFND